MTRAPLLHFIGALILLIGVVALNIFWYGMVSDESAQVGKIAGEIKLQTNNSALAAQAKQELTVLSADQASVQQYFVSTNDVVPFLQQLQTTGTYLGSNVQIASVSATPGVPYGKLSLAISIAGSFNAVMRTLGSIEYEPYDTAISTLTFDAPPGNTTSSGVPQWTANAIFLVGTEATPQASATSTP
jgi:hypothetical protein